MAQMDRMTADSRNKEKPKVFERCEQCPAWYEAVCEGTWCLYAEKPLGEQDNKTSDHAGDTPCGQEATEETHPYVVERYDQEDGSITYEIWDLRPDTYRRLCSINEWNDAGCEDDEERELSTAKSDAEMIVRALNLMNSGLP